ncbi:preprotein translocase subunit YajC [Bifidobacterium xylocopae]|uniref:Preprotein translocase subunit YajC n=2 Tax=Bifidobacterium xylocopae TaxID=2493119 RepID=A0A366KC66_9BIFI|nr:preprotein translocase subunit YajC [Bifidobacterium xylocopae]
MSSMFFLIVLIALMFGMTWWSSRKNKQRQGQVQDFRQTLKPGVEVATASGLLGKVVSVDLEKEQVVVDSEGSLSRWRIQAITKPPVVPAYVHDDEVDEEGNPLPEPEEELDGSQEGPAQSGGDPSGEHSEPSQDGHAADTEHQEPKVAEGSKEEPSGDRSVQD